MCLAGRFASSKFVLSLHLVAKTLQSSPVSEADNAPADKDANEIFAPEHVAGSIASSIRLSGTQGGVS